MYIQTNPPKLSQGLTLSADPFMMIPFLRKERYMRQEQPVLCPSITFAA